MRNKSILVVAIFSLFSFAPISLAATAIFRGLGDLPGGEYYSEAYQVSAYGNAVVGISSSANSYGGGPGSYHGYEAFIWTEANGMVGLGDLSGGEFDSFVWGVSCDGSYIAGYCNTWVGIWTNVVPCRWSGPNNILRLSQEIGNAYGISANGMTVVGQDNNGIAFRWTETNGMQELGLNEYGYALGISADGQIVSGQSSNEAFRWTEATGMVGLGHLPGGGFPSGAYDVSADGLVIVGDSNGANGYEAFRWTQTSGMIGLGQLPGGRYSSAYGVSGNGTVVVGEANGCAFIWDANHGMQRLKDVLENAYGFDLTGWRLYGAYDISADGRTIVGDGIDPNGKTQGWMAVLGDPPPSFELTVQVEPNDAGIDKVTPSIGRHLYYQNWPVLLRAETFKKCPNVYRFSHWIGDVSEPNSATATLVMTGDKTITAVYHIDERRCGDECHPILQGDLNKDCYINMEDFAIYCAQWLSCTHPDCD